MIYVGPCRKSLRHTKKFHVCDIGARIRILTNSATSRSDQHPHSIFDIFATFDIFD